MPGAGKYRGGIGLFKSQHILTDGIITHESERHSNVPRGIFGGKEGAAGKCEIYNVASNDPAREMHSKFHGPTRWYHFAPEGVSLKLCTT